MIKSFKNIERKCWFLLAMSYLVFVFLGLLNGFLIYRIFSSFKGDGWQFMESLIFAMFLIASIPALIFSLLSIRLVKKNSHKKFYFPLIIGIIGVIIGFVLQSATNWWIVILILHLLLVISTLVCNNSNITSNKIKLSVEEAKVIDTNLNRDTRVALFFQIIGLILLLIVAISSVYNISSSAEKHITNQLVISAFIFPILFIFQSILSFAFYKKQQWAFNLKYIENYIKLGLLILISISALITEGFSFSKSFFVLLFIFILLISLFIYLIKLYKRIKA